MVKCIRASFLLMSSDMNERPQKAVTQIMGYIRMGEGGDHVPRDGKVLGSGAKNKGKKEDAIIYICMFQTW